MKNFFQQTRFDSPMTTIKFLCINYSSIKLTNISKIHHIQLLNREIIKSLGR